jgi:hypothetical protein
MKAFGSFAIGGDTWLLAGRALRDEEIWSAVRMIVTLFYPFECVDESELAMDSVQTSVGELGLSKMIAITLPQ